MHRIVPDACVDIVWTRGRLVVAGPATGPVMTELPAGSPAFGVRFRVGAAGAALGLPGRGAARRDGAARRRVGRRGGASRRRPRPAGRPPSRPPLPRGSEREPDRAVRAAAQGADVGLGDRQLRRRFADAVGYGPKTLDRILRFQRFLVLARAHAAAALARLALEAGYADQAHLTRECTRLSGLPPAALLASGAGPAGERSDSFKTAGPALATMAA